jgi:hypothetical protein
MQLRTTIAALLLLTSGCSRAPEQDKLGNAANTQQTYQEPLNPPDPGEPGGLADDRTPVAEGAIDPRSAEGAAQVLQRYFALIEAGKAGEAGRLWSDGSEKLDLSRYSEVHANIGAPRGMEGAAGSIYVDVPVQLYGRLKSGEALNARGTMTLRRANDVPGATAEQRQWHIYRADFPAQAAAADYRFIGRWAADERQCSAQAWRFTATALSTPAGSHCTFMKVKEVPGGYDIAARCTAEAPPVNDTLKLRFAESARALLFESGSIADAGLVRCP